MTSLCAYAISQGWQKEQRRATALQQDLQFFKAASSSAISERDAAAFEAASTKADLDAANSTLQDTQVRVGPTGWGGVGWRGIGGGEGPRGEGAGMQHWLSIQAAHAWPYDIQLWHAQHVA
jgi:hypothetical protein